MNIKKNKMLFALSTALFLSMPLANVSAHEKHCEIEDTQLGDTMKYMKSELRAYVKGFKKDDAQKMQVHLNELLKLSGQAVEYTPVKIKNMAHDQSNMAAIEHGNMDGESMPEMDHSKMDHSTMQEVTPAEMKEMDHANMDHGDMNHGDMNMQSADHDMSTMSSMAGMSNEQHHQHMLYMQGMEQLNDLFKKLANTQDKSEIKTILGQVKEHSKKSHQQFRQDCN